MSTVFPRLSSFTSNLKLGLSLKCHLLQNESLFSRKYREYVWFLSNFTDQCIKLYQWCIKHSLRSTAPRSCLRYCVGCTADWTISWLLGWLSNILMCWWSHLILWLLFLMHLLKKKALSGEQLAAVAYMKFGINCLVSTSNCNQYWVWQGCHCHLSRQRESFAPAMWRTAQFNFSFAALHNSLRKKKIKN